MALVIATANQAAAPPGDLDPTFDGDGKVTTDFAGAGEVANGVAVQGNGKIVAAGLAFVSGSQDLALARYNTDGSLDTTFSGDGKVTTDFAGGDDQAFEVAIQGDGKIVAAGCVACENALGNFAIARYNSDGSLDTTFSGDGRVTTDFAGNRDEARAVAIQGDGKIVAAGVAFLAEGFVDFALARYNTDGSLDITFSGDGRVTTDFPGSSEDVANGVAIQGDGKIVAAGQTAAPSADFALARYNSDGSLDTTFSGDGKVTTAFAGSFDEPRGASAGAVAIHGDGKIVAAGSALVSVGNGFDNDFALARYKTDGSLDKTFGSGLGRVATDFAGDRDDEAHAVALQGDGKIVAAGFTFQPDAIDFALARYNTNGSLDPIFSGDGKVTTDFAGQNDAANGVTIQGNGKIVAAGSALVSGNADFALARYTVCRPSSRVTTACP